MVEWMRYLRRISVITALIATTLVACGSDTIPAPPSDEADNTEPPATTAETPTSTTEPVTGEDRSDELVGRWMIEFYEDASSSRTNVLGDEPPFIEFGADGSVTFHTSCNPGTGTYSTDGVYFEPESRLDEQPEGQPIRIEDLSIGTATCEGFIGEQDTDLFNDFSSATRFVLNDGRLVLWDEFFLVEAVPAG